MEKYFCHANLTFCAVLKTNYNPNTGIEVVRGEMMAFGRLVLHLTCVNLPVLSTHANFNLRSVFHLLIYCW